MPKRIFFAGILTITGLFFSHTALALTVSPAKKELQADPDSVVVGEIELFNDQDEAKRFFTSFENFESRGDSGAPHFTGSGSGLATWIESEPEVTIESGQRILVPYTIRVPADAEPGGYFSAIFFGSQEPQGSGAGEVTIGGKVGVLILLRVNGDVDETAGLVNFRLSGSQRVVDSLPVTLEYNFNNEGGDKTVPRGEIVIKNTFRVTTEKLLANGREGNVLPNSTRKFEIVWGAQNAVTLEEEGAWKYFLAKVQSQRNDFRFGWYTAYLDLSWGESVQVATARVHFFIIPWHLLIILFILLSVVCYVGKKGIKKYNSHIIAQATAKK